MLGKHEKKGRLEHTCCCEGKEHGLPLRPAPVCAPGHGRAPRPAPAMGHTRPGQASGLLQEAGGAAAGRRPIPALPAPHSRREPRVPGAGAPQLSDTDRRVQRRTPLPTHRDESRARRAGRLSGFSVPPAPRHVPCVSVTAVKGALAPRGSQNATRECRGQRPK